MSGIVNRSFAFSDFTLPPYWIITQFATSFPYIFSISSLIHFIVSFASSFVAVFPVPIAQIGSYAIIVFVTSSSESPSKASFVCVVTISFAEPFSLCSKLSPTHTIGFKSKLKAFLKLSKAYL